MNKKKLLASAYKHSQTKDNWDLEEIQHMQLQETTNTTPILTTRYTTSSEHLALGTIR